MAEGNPQVDESWKAPQQRVPGVIKGIAGDYAWVVWSDQLQRLVALAELEAQWTYIDPVASTNQYGVVYEDGMVTLTQTIESSSSLTPREAMFLAAWIVFLINPESDLFDLALNAVKLSQET